MTQLEFFQPTKRKKGKKKQINNRKQTASSSPNSHIPHHGCVQKQSLVRRSGMPLRTVIKIKIKITKLTHTHTHTHTHIYMCVCVCVPWPSVSYQKRESEPEREGERESELSFSKPATKRTPNRIKFVGPQTNNETHLTPLSGRRAMPK